MGHISKVLLFIALVMGFIACKQDDCCVTDNDILKPIELGELKSTGSHLAGELFAEVIKNEDEAENVIISPLSIQTALYMTYNGSAGDTRKAMAETLGWPANTDPQSLNNTYQELLSALAPLSDSVIMHLANAVFWDKNRIVPHDVFLESMENSYDAALMDEAFEQDPEGTLEKINHWVNEKTEGRIEKILEQLSPEEVMFIINALYIKASWENSFDPLFTYENLFTKDDGQEITVPFMSKDYQLDYYKGENYQAVKLPFKDSSYAMHFILPNKDVDDLIVELDFPAFFESLNTDYHKQRIQLYLPKFETAYKINLNQALKSLGMDIAFDPYHADFSNLGDAAGNLYISRVEHKTFFEMDEKGVEGAAVTAVGIGVTSLPPQIRFDKPFLFVLYHHSSEIPIFIGKIGNPKSK